MTAGAIARGVRGVIISGRCRDVLEHRASNFPVFARGHSTLGQSSFTRPSGIDVSLTISTGDDGTGMFPTYVSVEPGDWMVADEDGVVCVPKEMVGKVLELAATGKEVDARCLADIQRGVGVQESFRRHRGK